MLFTSYFQNDVMVKRPYIQLSWLELALTTPLRREVQSDSRIRHWVWVDELNHYLRVVTPLRREVQSDGRIRHWVWVDELNHYLRVVTLEDGSTVHNAFPDRRFSP